MMGTGVQAGSGRLLGVSVGGTDVALLILQQTPGRGIMSEEKILWGGVQAQTGVASTSLQHWQVRVPDRSVAEATQSRAAGLKTEGRRESW